MIGVLGRARGTAPRPPAAYTAPRAEPPNAPRRRATDRGRTVRVLQVRVPELLPVWCALERRVVLRTRPFGLPCFASTSLHAFIGPLRTALIHSGFWGPPARRPCTPSTSHAYESYSHNQGETSWTIPTTICETSRPSLMDMEPHAASTLMGIPSLVTAVNSSIWAARKRTAVR